MLFVVAASAFLTLAGVRANIAAAYGTPPASERIVTKIVHGAQTGTQVDLRSGDDFRSDVTLGPLHSANGSCGGVAWAQNENGETWTDPALGDDDAGPLTDEESTTESLTHVHAPSDLYVIAKTGNLGFGTKTYVDPTTWFIVRRETIDGAGTRTTLYDDFRKTGGYVRAWHVTASDGHPENDATSTIQSDDVTPVAAAALAIPPDTHPFVSFPEGVSMVRLPGLYDKEQGVFIVRLTIGGRGLDFLLDTGAAGIVIDREVARQLSLPVYDSYSNGANAGRYVGTSTIVPSVSIGPLALHDVEMDTIPSGERSVGDYKVVGLLGFDFIEAVGLKLDYDAGAAYAYRPETFALPDGPTELDLDIGLASESPEVGVTINGVTGKHFLLDTGGAGAVLITDAFRRRNPDAVVDENRQSFDEQLVGVGGTFDAKFVRLATISIGNLNFTNFGAHVVADSSVYGEDGGDGIVGPDLLRRFDVYLDYRHHKVRMILNRTGTSEIVHPKNSP